MKTITLDYDLYMKELQAKFEQGEKHGIWLAEQYIRNPKSHYISGKDYAQEREDLDNAVRQRLGNKACSLSIIDDLIDNDKLEIESGCMPTGAARLEDGTIYIYTKAC